MGFSSLFHTQAEQSYQQYQQLPAEHKGEFSHEALGGAAAFLAMREYEKHQEGGPGDHALAKEFLAGAVGFEVDKLAETKGLDFLDKEKAKHEAEKQAEQMYSHQYNNGNGFGEAGSFEDDRRAGGPHHGGRGGGHGGPHGGRGGGGGRGWDRERYQQRHGGGW